MLMCALTCQGNELNYNKKSILPNFEFWCIMVSFFILVALVGGWGGGGGRRLSHTPSFIETHKDIC